MVVQECPKLTEIVTLNQESITTISGLISLNQGEEFSLILVRCNYLCLVQQYKILEEIENHSNMDIKSLCLLPNVESVYQEITKVTQSNNIDVLMVFGISEVLSLDNILRELNQQRDQFPLKFRFPIVLWVNDDVLVKLREFPDLDNFCRTVISLSCPPDLSINCIQEVAKGILDKILENGAGILWQLEKDTTFDECRGFLHISQLEAAKRDLKEQHINLTPELEASLEFLLGHSPELPPEERQQHYQKSLQLWRQIGNWQYEGCVLYCLGLLAITYAMQNPAQRDVYFAIAQRYLYHCIRTFDKANRPDLESKFINALAEGYKRRKQWDKLKDVAERALNLHQEEYGDKVRETRARGYLAEVAVAERNWNDAQQYATKACQILEKVCENSNDISPEEKELEYSFHYGWYLLSLAQSQRNLEQMQEAIKSLNIAKQKTSPQNDPELYIKILNELRECYKESCEYLKAFEIKQERQQIEQQFGFKAFIGVGQLQPRKLVTNPAYLTLATSVKEEIAGSGRNEKASLLKEWIQDNQHKLIVIYGPSGGGKSSFLTGLIPVLKQVRIEKCPTLIIVQNNYQNWHQQLCNELNNSLSQQNKDVPLSEVNNVDIFQTLTKIKGHRHNLYTILIFDDFESFFDRNQNLSDRQKFYNFLEKLLRRPFLKVVFSLREEYLHYLLECNRQVELKESCGYILHKDNLIYVGNFDRDQAKKVIENLTQLTVFNLEADLIERVVSDLSEESGEVRPLELQLVGYQLQEKNIKTLQEYGQKGGKINLIRDYIEEVIRDCGSENQKIARLILYLLTGEPPDTRPTRKKEELFDSLQELKLPGLDDRQLETVLTILVASKLVTLQPEIDIDQYQIAYEYLISLIREIVEINHPQEVTTLDTQKQTKRELRKLIELKELYSKSQVLIQDHDQLEALHTTVKLSQELNVIEFRSHEIDELKRQTLKQLRHLVYDIQEANRLEGHTSDVYRVTFSPDGKLIASASWDKTIRIWSSDGTLSQKLEGHEKAVNSVQFSPDGTVLASASADGTVKLWNWDLEEKCVDTFQKQEDWLWYVTFSPDSKIIASAGSDCKIQLWNLKGKKLDTLEGHQERVYCVNFSSDGRFLVSSSEDNLIIIWQRGDNNRYSPWKKINCEDDFHFVVFSSDVQSDVQTIAAGGEDKVIKIWNLDGELIKTLEGHSDCVNSVQFSPDGKFLASASNDKTIKLWHVEYGICLHTFRGHENWVNDISFSRQNPNEKLLIFGSASHDNTVRIWKYQPTLDKSFQGKDRHQKKVSSAIFSSDGQIIASASWDHTIKLWNLNGTLHKTLQDPNLENPESHTDWVWEASFSSDDQLLASASGDQTVKIWSINTSRTPYLLDSSQEIPTFSLLDNQEIKNIEAKLEQTLLGHDSCVHSVSFSPDNDNRLLASGGNDNDIRLWHKDAGGTWNYLQTLTEHEDLIWQVRFHETPHGLLLASASADGTVKLWRENGDHGQFKLLATLKEHENWVNSISFNRDGTMLASVGNDGIIIIWSLKSNEIGKRLNTIKEAHDARIYNVDFSPDGLMLASSSADRTIKVWSLDGTLLKTLEGHEEWVNSVNFSPVDNQMLVSASSDHTVKLWRLPPIPLLDPNKAELEQLLDRGCQWLQDYLRTNQQINSQNQNEESDSQSKI